MVYADLAAQAAYVGGVPTDQMNSIENLTGEVGDEHAGGRRRRQCADRAEPASTISTARAEMTF